MRGTATPSLATLTTMVQRLGVECPWTKAQATEDLIFWARKELIEVEEVLRAAKGSGGGKAAPLNGNELVKELGDVLFDTLMMIMVAQREHPQSGVSLEACAASACVKVQRRCPYVFDANAKAAGTVAEAEEAWQAAKKRESTKELAGMEGTKEAVNPPPAAAVSGREKVAPRDEEEEEDDDDGGLAEWESDFQANAGPPLLGEESDTEDDDDDEIRPAQPDADVRTAPHTNLDAAALYSDDDDDGGLAEWRRDYSQADVGPTQDGDDSSDDDSR